jgi:glycosyltransferase involved in cell wall biosynthesis
MKKLSIVIPCYNEAKNIPLILDRLEKVLTSDSIEILLVDNGSNDESAEVMAKLVPDYPFARIVTVDVNEGYGNGVLRGLAEAVGETLAWTHADMQTDPYDVIKAWDLMKSQPDMTKVYIKGVRRGRGLFDEFFTFGMSLFETLLLKKKLWDINAQPNMFHRSFYESWDNPPLDFSLDLFAYYKAVTNGLEIKRFEVFFPERIHGESSWNTGLGAKWKFIKRTVEFSITLRKNLH